MLFLKTAARRHLDMWDPNRTPAPEVKASSKLISHERPACCGASTRPKYRQQMQPMYLIRSRSIAQRDNAQRARVYCGLDRITISGEIGGRRRPDDYPAIGSVMGIYNPPRKRCRRRDAAVHHEGGRAAAATPAFYCGCSAKPDPA